MVEDSIVQYITPCEMGYQNGMVKTSGLPPDANGSTTLEKEVLFTMQPNPAQTTVALNWLNFTPNSSSKITVYNSQGVVVMQATELENATLHLNVEGLPTGLYFVHLAHNGEIATIEKLIVK